MSGKELWAASRRTFLKGALVSSSAALALSACGSGDVHLDEDGAQELSDQRAFRELSAALTGFQPLELEGTGQTGPYLSELTHNLGFGAREALLQSWRQSAQGAARVTPALAERYIKTVSADPVLGPIAKNVAKMWLLGIWYAMPETSTQSRPSSIAVETHVVSAQAYGHGLAWAAMDTHAMGAQEPGFASWAVPPAG